MMLLASVLTGCSHAPESREPDDPRPTRTVRYPEINYSYVWSTGPSANLTDRSEELVRASFEAWTYAYFVGPDQSYPGFDRAISKAVQANDPKVGFLRGLASQDPARKPAPRTIFAHIADLSATSTDVTAVTCWYFVAADRDAPQQEKWLTRAVKIGLHNSTATPGNPGIPDTDPDHADPRAHMPPTWDVFGTWNVTELNGVWPNEIPAPGCTPWWHERFPDFAVQPDGTLDAPPGWQPPMMPVAVQYPEWIGPSPQ
ncbi:hypothetical protein [Nocardia transvalensis]|uniref:hypothetical protein n=1 Tax=Nocardia transvalensis TaxID=37333 RepID=UPI001E472F13|nr:hypothetical protein [Nocardia transvalensis]MBF6331851.1 hypothetical protein [Nocardia transvalensis]